MLKEAAEDELVQAVRCAVAGEIYLNPQLGARIAAEPPIGSADRDHRQHIQQKLQLSGRAELVRYALNKGLFDPN